jgi:DNA-binding beta-propeller fold protein YncE
LADGFRSPWDVVWWQGRLVVANAGTHQLLDADGAVLAGTGVEGLRDGPAEESWLAQPSGLAADGDRLWFVDAETSALRWLEDGQVHTAVGEGLFDFGHRDGPAGQALLQHPLGVALLPDRSVVVCDTYNDAVRRFDPAAGTVTTLATGVGEPSGAVVAGRRLAVVESTAHRVNLLPLAAAIVVAGPALRTERPSVLVAPGPVELEVCLLLVQDWGVPGARRTRRGDHGAAGARRDVTPGAARKASEGV